MAHRVENPEPITKLRPDVPLELVEIIGQMTAKTPELRFQTAKEVAEKLQAWLHDSASGREYSRISALMAAAMRAKQPGSEDTQSKSESAASPELELAFLDDEPAKSSGEKVVEGRRTESGRLFAGDSRDRLRKLNPGDSGKTAALPKAKADLLLETQFPADARCSCASAIQTTPRQLEQCAQVALALDRGGSAGVRRAADLGDRARLVAAIRPAVRSGVGRGRQSPLRDSTVAGGGSIGDRWQRAIDIAQADAETRYRNRQGSVRQHVGAPQRSGVPALSQPNPRADEPAAADPAADEPAADEPGADEPGTDASENASAGEEKRS